jgi:hypothetical protein
MAVAPVIDARVRTGKTVDARSPGRTSLTPFEREDIEPFLNYIRRQHRVAPISCAP